MIRYKSNVEPFLEYELQNGFIRLWYGDEEEGFPINSDNESKLYKMLDKGIRQEIQRLISAAEYMSKQHSDLSELDQKLQIAELLGISYGELTKRMYEGELTGHEFKKDFIIWHDASEKPMHGKAVLLKLTGGEVREGHWIGTINKYHQNVNRWKVYRTNITVNEEDVIEWADKPIGRGK